jgi:hypothetical protein
VDLDVLTEAIDRLSGSDPLSYADVESIEILHRQQARLDALVTKATAGFDAAGNWVPDGARNAVAWLTARCRLPKSQARRMVNRGRALRHLPKADQAWSEGQIGGAQVDLLAESRKPATEEALARDEQMLVTQASLLPYAAFARAIAYWKQLADPDGAEEDDEKRRDRRDVYLEKSFGGMWLGKITLDPVSGAIVGEELERLYQEMFEADWAEAKTRLGFDPAGADLRRTQRQRRADALVEMATRSQMAPVNGRRPAPLFTVVVDYELVRGRLCELADGVVVAPGTLLPWLTEAYIERVVFAPGRRVEVSEKARLFTGATRRGIELRDQECQHPMCDVRAGKCQVDHIIPFAAGGPTTEENGRILCGFHNRLRNGPAPPDSVSAA